MKCLSPLRIRNKYTKEWMYVNCRKCSACLINKANGYAFNLKEELKKYPFQMMVTLTYDNNHLPFLVRGNNHVYRGIYDSFPTDIGKIDVDIGKFEKILPNGFPEGEFTGVIYYKDIKDFIKRLRIHYERKFKRKFPYKYHLLSEYGTIGKRPHFHALFFGETEFDADFRDAVIENWKMCDWSRLDLEKSFEFASEGVSSYLSSYLNSLFSCNGFLLTKGIQSSVCRSKNSTYAVKNEIQKDFQENVRRGFSKDIQRKDGYPIRFWDTTKLDSFSIRLLPKRVLFTLFQVPAGLCKSSFNDFRRSIEYSLVKSPTKWENSDYLTNLSYIKYCKIRKRERGDLSTMMDYALDAWSYRNYYACNVIAMSMMDYQRITKKEYYATRYNTLVENPNIRELRQLFRGIKTVDGLHTDNNKAALDKYVDNYKYKLLPKHLKEICNGFNI